LGRWELISRNGNRRISTTSGAAVYLAFAAHVGGGGQLSQAAGVERFLVGERFHLSVIVSLAKRGAVRSGCAAGAHPACCIFIRRNNTPAGVSACKINPKQRTGGAQLGFIGPGDNGGAGQGSHGNCLLSQPDGNPQDYAGGGGGIYQKTAPPGRLFNSYNWGGYLLWELPEYPVFIDGRTDLYNDELINEWLQVMRGEPGWQEALDRWQVRLVLLEPGAPVVEQLAPNVGSCSIKTSDRWFMVVDYQALTLNQEEV